MVLADLHPRSDCTAVGETKSQDYIQDKQGTGQDGTGLNDIHKSEGKR